MSTRNKFAWTILVLFAFTTAVFAANSAQWDNGYPKTGTMNGTILVKGSVTLDTGWHVKIVMGHKKIKITATNVLNPNDKKEYNPDFNVNGTTFGEIGLDGLTSGQTYYVVGIVTVTNDTIDQDITTSSVGVMAK